MATTQQQQCYDAQDALDRGRLFKSVADAQRFVDDLRENRWWHAQGYSIAVLRIEVGGAKGLNSVGWYDKDKNAGRIELTAHGLCLRTVLHEVAHVLSQAQYGSKSHDPWWARTYLTLVSCVMGPDAYLTLQRSFDKHGVDYTVPMRGSSAIPL